MKYRRFVLASLLVAGCGVPTAEHQRTVAELDATKAELSKAQERVRNLEARVQELSETDAMHWSQVVQLRQQTPDADLVDPLRQFIGRWPDSSHADEAKEMLRKVEEVRAERWLARAREQIAAGQHADAKESLEIVIRTYPGSRSATSAQAELRAIGPKIAALARRAMGNGRWRSRTETSPIDDSTNVYLQLVSDDSFKGPFGNTVNPELWIRCKERKTELYVDWDVYLGLNETTVLHRLDQAPAQRRSWSVSTDNKATFYSGSDSGFAKQLAAHQSLLLQVTPYGENTVTARFNLAGLENALEPLRKACKW